MIQLQALTYILDNKDKSFITTNNLTDDFFSDYKDEFNFIKNHIADYGNVPDKETFLATFKDFDIIKVNEKPDYILDELYKDRNTRSIASTFNKIRSLLNEKKIDEAMALYANASQNISKAVHLKSIDILKDTSRYDDYIERGRDIKQAYVKTGFKELDDIIGGWDRNEEYATLVARSNVGKSWLLLKTAVAAAEQGLNVGIYSGEMSSNKVGYRIDTLLGHLSNRQLIRGDVEVQNSYKNYFDTIASKVKGSIRVLTPNMIGGPAGVTALKAFIEKDNLDMLCIDQHSLLEDDRKAKNPVEKAANISKDIKNLQVMERIPIITVSQQNRESTENGFDTKLIAQSDRIGQDSTVVLFFEKKDNIMTMYLVKSRDSVNEKKLQYALDFDKGIFTYIPTEDDGLGGNECENIRQEYNNESLNGENVF